VLARAAVDGPSTVTLTPLDAAAGPLAFTGVRYAWQGFPLCVLTGAAQLPTAPFLSDVAAMPPSPTRHRAARLAAGAASLSADVVVYGSTPAGIAAAVAARRGGASVLLLHPYAGPPGGMPAAGGLAHTDYLEAGIVGGIAREFFLANARHYNVSATEPLFMLESRVAAALFAALLADAGVPVVATLEAATAALSAGKRVTSVLTADGKNVSGGVFIDASYEGDLLVAAGISTSTGRESAARYGEPRGGVTTAYAFCGWEDPVDFCLRVSPFGADGELLPFMTPAALGAPGEGDNLTQAYNFRLCMTRNTSNQAPLPAPVPGTYNASDWTLLRRWAASGQMTVPPFWFVPTVGDKVDVNSQYAFSTDFAGGSWGFPTATPAGRAAIWQAHYDYTVGLIHTVLTAPEVPPAVRANMSGWGLCADEFEDNGHWPHLLYTREVRRMRGPRGDDGSGRWAGVLTEPNITAPASWGNCSIGMGNFDFDAHAVQRVPCVFNATDGHCEGVGAPAARAAAAAGETVYSATEGYPGLWWKPYELPFAMLLPDGTEAVNVLSPTVPATSHVAFSTVRMEPQFMVLGQAAGVAAALAIGAAPASPLAGAAAERWAATPLLQRLDVNALTAALAAAGAVLHSSPPPPGAPPCKGPF